MKAKSLLSFKCRLFIFALCISLIPITALTLTYYFHSRNIVALILGIVGSTSVIILGIMIANSMSKPITKLANATEILASGNLNHRVQICRNDEIGILANSFNTMAKNLNNGITAYKLTEESLRESEERFKTIFNSAIDGILMADPNTKKLFLGNNAICQMLGYTVDEIKTLSVADIHPKESLPYVLEQFEKQSRGGIPVAKDIPVKRKDESVFFADINASRITLDKKTYLMGIFRDITEQKRILEELRTLNESLEQRVAERTAAVEKVNEKLRIEISEHKKLKEDLVYLADYDSHQSLQSPPFPERIRRPACIFKARQCRGDITVP